MSEVWYDTRLGDLLVGEAAVEVRIEQTGPGDIVPLQEAIFAPRPARDEPYEPMFRDPVYARRPYPVWDAVTEQEMAAIIARKRVTRRRWQERQPK